MNLTLPLATLNKLPSLIVKTEEERLRLVQSKPVGQIHLLVKGIVFLLTIVAFEYSFISLP
jgi:hypothetical protein